MHSTFRKGQEAILAVQQRALEKNVTVCIPTIEQRYDLVLVDDQGKCLRAQVKYADSESTDGSVELDLRKETRNDGSKKTYSSTEIDVLLVYLPKAKSVLSFDSLVFAGRQSLTIRFQPAKNGQEKGIFFYQKYLW